MAIRAAELQVVVGADTSPAVGVLRGAMSTIGGIASTALGVFTGNLMTQAIGALSGLGIAAVKAVADYEQLSITLESLVAKEMMASGSARTLADALKQAGGASQELLGWIEELALKSPYATSQVASAFTQLVSYGFSTQDAQSLTRAMLTFGSATGRTTQQIQNAAYAFAQLHAAGKLNMQDLRQLLNAGIPVNEILQEMGYSFEDVGKKAISSSDFFQKFAEIVERDFGGAGDRVSDTINGILGAFQDFKEIGLRELVAGFLEPLKPLFGKLRDWLLGEGREKLREVGEKLGEIGAWIADKITEALSKGGIVDKIRGVIGKITVTIEEIFSKIDWGRIRGIIRTVGESVARIYPYFSSLLPPLMSIAGAIKEIGGVIGENLLALLRNLGETITTVILPALGIDGAMAVENFRAGLAGFANLLSTQVVPLLQEVLPVAVQVLATVFKSVASAISAAITLMKTAISALRQAWENDFLGIRTTITNLFENALAVFRLFVAAFQGDWREVGRQLRIIVDNIIGTMKAQWGGAWNILRAIVQDLAQKIVSTIRNTDWPGLGRAILEGIVNGIKNGSKWLIETVAAVVKAAVEVVKGYLGIQSPSKLFEDEIAGNMMRGWIRGIEKMKPRLNESLARSLSVVNALSLSPPVSQQGVITFYGPVVFRVEEGKTLRDLMRELQ